MTKDRFSKNKMLVDLSAKCTSLEREYGFKEGWGWKRVEHRSPDVIVAFGRYSAMLDMMEEYA